MKIRKCILLFSILPLLLIGCKNENNDTLSTNNDLCISSESITDSSDELTTDQVDTHSSPEPDTKPSVTPKNDFVDNAVSIITPPSDNENTTPIAPVDYQKMLGKGMDVDWSKTSQGREYYNEQAVIDFKNAGISHVRIRVKDKISDIL